MSATGLVLVLSLVAGCQRTGVGVARLSNGSRYAGSFGGGTRSGTGLLVMPNGSFYVGEWWGNNFHGRGLIRGADGVRQAGEFRRGKRILGHVPWPLEDCRLDPRTGLQAELVLGPCVEGLASGVGQASGPGGARYFGRLQRGFPHGPGWLIRDGESHFGAFEAGLRQGPGATLRGGRWLLATWHRGRRITPGLLLDADGRSRWIPPDSASPGSPSAGPARPTSTASPSGS